MSTLLRLYSPNLRMLGAFHHSKVPKTTRSQLHASSRAASFSLDVGVEAQLACRRGWLSATKIV